MLGFFLGLFIGLLFGVIFTCMVKIDMDGGDDDE